jgi:hypothetical protein
MAGGANPGRVVVRSQAPDKVLIRFFGVLVASCAAQAMANPLLECRFPGFAGLDPEGLLKALEASGGQDCRPIERAWGISLQCEGAVGARALGFPVHEVRGAITNAGLRRTVGVTRASEERVQLAAARVAVGEGLRLEVQGREDGATLILCIAPGSADAGSGLIEGVLPALPPGGIGWQVCAESVADDGRTCVEAGPQGYRIEGLRPGDYRIRARPIGAVDEGLGLVLARRSDLQSGRRQDVLLRYVTVRAGAVSKVGELTPIRLAEP